MLTGLTAVLIKQLTAHDDPDKIVFLTNMMLMPLSLVPALLVWTWPTPALLPALLGMGVCAVLGHVALVRGYAATDASLAHDLRVLQLPFTVAIAYLAFGETIDRLDLGRRARSSSHPRSTSRGARPSSGAQPRSKQPTVAEIRESRFGLMLATSENSGVTNGQRHDENRQGERFLHRVPQRLGYVRLNAPRTCR